VTFDLHISTTNIMGVNTLCALFVHTRIPTYTHRGEIRNTKAMSRMQRAPGDVSENRKHCAPRDSVVSSRYQNTKVRNVSCERVNK